MGLSDGYKTAGSIVTKSSSVLLNTLEAADNYAEAAKRRSEHTLNTYAVENAAELAELKERVKALTIDLDDDVIDIEALNLLDEKENNNGRTIDLQETPVNKETSKVPTWVYENNGEVDYIYLQFNKYKHASLWHMTHRDNVAEILNKGILSNAAAHNEVNPRDISDHGAQQWRENKDPYYDRKIHEYAPMYFKIKNPMLSVRRDIQDELCLIEISLSVLSENEFLITDGNASSRDTNFYNSLDKLDLLPWDVLNSGFWPDFEDGKRKMCAEVLVFPRIAPKHIKQIHCYSANTLQYLSRLDCNVIINRKMFFEK